MIASQLVGRRAAGADDGASSGAEPLADPDEDGAEQRLLVREVPVDGGAADADGGAEVFEADAAEAALGEEARRLVQDRRLAVGLRAVAVGPAAPYSLVILRLILANLDLS